MSSPDIRLPHLEGSSFDEANRQSSIANLPCHGGGEGIRTPDPRVANAVLCQLSYTPDSLPIANFRLPIDRRRTIDQIGNWKSAIGNSEGWLRGRDLNPRPLGYEPNELPDCSTPRQSLYQKTPRIREIKSAFRNSKSAIRWWAWVESNYRPHAYQACALTN
jgi:hypothetical protein